MVNLGTDEMAKYPFLGQAGLYLKDKGFNLEQLGTDPDLKPIIEKALQRIETASTGKIYRSNFSTVEQLDLEVFSFLVAVILLKLTGMNSLIKRFSLAEARRAESYLEKDLKNTNYKNNEDLAVKIIEELFSISVKKERNYFVLPISDYIFYAINFHEKEWKLINRRVDHGMVFLTSHETVRLVRKELTNFISTKIKNALTPPMLREFREPVKKLISLGKNFSIPTSVSTEYPPCIKRAIEVLEKGENLSHSGRFLLGTFLLGRGKTIESIAPLFKNAPDYNEKVTLYQLNHLAGKSGNKTEYKCPSCEKVKSEDLCFAIPECDKIINPVQFGKKTKINA